MKHENIEELKEEIRNKMQERSINGIKKVLEEIKPQDIALLFEELEDEEIIVLYRIFIKKTLKE